MPRFFGSRLSSRLPALLPGSLRRIDSKKEIVLSFDDGPHPLATDETLTALGRHGLAAVFFFTGREAQRFPDMVRRTVAEGHSVQIHGWSHTSLATISRRLVRDEIQRSQALVQDITGIMPVLFRPPFGRWNPFFSSLLDEMDLQLVLWNNMPQDFDPRRSPVDIIQYLDTSVRSGDIIVLHDNARTVGRIGPIIDGLASVLERKDLTTSTVILSPIKKTRKL